jgi:thiamine biosynthesis protein ThiS
VNREDKGTGVNKHSSGRAGIAAGADKEKQGDEMNIKINGKGEYVEKAGSIAELISRKGLSCDRIVVEHNLRVVPREEWAGIALQENDNIEIVSFVGGG